MNVAPLHPAFAAEISGVDLRDDLPAATIAAIREAACTYGVIVFHDQPLANEQQIAFALRLDGELQTARGRTAIDPGHDKRHTKEINEISNIAPDGKIMDIADRRLAYGLANRLWHTDASFQNPAGRFSMLSARTIPERGGETEYADTCAAYDALPAETKDEIAALQAHHSIAYSRMTLGVEFSPEELIALKGVPQPLVRDLPETGRKSLYVASHCSHIVDWPVAKGRLFLHDLIEHATQPTFVYRHTWKADDFIIWDNRRTMHRGRPHAENERRDMRRVTTLDR